MYNVKDAKIIFASSVSVYGAHEGMEPPRKAADPISGTDNYFSVFIKFY